jgi:hypothetical protein
MSSRFVFARSGLQITSGAKLLSVRIKEEAMPFGASLSMKAKKFARVSVCTLTALCFLLLAASPRIAAQTASAGVVLGTVTDASGAVVPGVGVDLTNVATGITVHQTTNAKGQYLFPEVAAGAYTLTFKADRFRTATLQNVTVEINKSFTGNMQMQLGSVSQTVEVRASAQAELQTTDAQVGDVIAGQELEHLPTLTRNAIELIQLQPVTTPGAGDSGGTVAGSRSDQNAITLDGIDISDSIIGGQGDPAIQGQPASIENVQEFRTGVTNSNVTFGRAPGGQTALVSRSGTNAYHGDAYWYTQNSEFNANTWDNNRSGIPEPSLKDNRAGVSVGGPIIKNKTFFFANYEIHRFPNDVDFTDIVPTPPLKAGVLQFPDATGTVRQYNLATSTACGSTGGQPCDPRGLGISPTVRALWNLLPTGHNTSAGDGLNTIGFSDVVSEPTKDDDVSFRLDHNFTDKIHFFGRYFYDRDIEPLPQLDIENGNAMALGSAPDRNDAAVGGLDYQITSNITNEFRFAWIRSRADVIGDSGESSATALALPGTTSSVTGLFVALQPSISYLNLPIDNTQISRTQLLNGTTKEFVDNFFWTKGSHTIIAGTDTRFLPFLLSHTDHNIATTSPTALLDNSGATGTITIPAATTPPTCGGAVTTNCLLPADVAEWDSLYAGTLGIVNNVNLVGARNGNLQPYPLLTNINSNTTEAAYDFYVQDTWRTTRSLTLTYGLAYGWQTPATETNGLQSLLANNENNNSVIEAQDYVNAKASAAEQGNAYDPTLSFVPIRDSGRSTLYNTDWNDWAPRVSAAWNPSFDSGALGRIFGPGKTVIRGGFGIAYDRTNIVSNVLSSLLGVGFSDVFETSPLCNASGTPGGGCPASPVAGVNPGLNSFRIGQDGIIPLPTVTALTSPIVPADYNLFTNPAGAGAEPEAVGVDPNYKIGRNYMLDLTIQRELPANFLLETGYIGRLGRDLPSAIDLDAAPYFVKDPSSGQTFAQAFDNIGCILRGDAGQKIAPSFTCPNGTATNLPAQPFFENQLAGLGAVVGTATSTQALADLIGSNITNADAFTTFLVMNSFRTSGFSTSGVLPSYNNLQVYGVDLLETGQGISNYNAWFVTLHRRASNGLQFSINYTLSESLDEQGQVQNNAARFSTPFNQDLQYGPSIFNHPNVFNAIYDYELPFGTGHRFVSDSGVVNRIIGGWYTAGIFTASSGSPIYATQGANYGSDLSAGEAGSVADIPTAPISSGVNHDVIGSDGIGTDGNPANGGSGINLFANPQQVFDSLRAPLLSVDGRTGEAHPIYGFGFWNMDMRVGKVTPIAETVKMELSVDAFNLFNNVNFADPTNSGGAVDLDMTNPAAFGVVTASQTLTNHNSPSRYLQFGLRFEF